MSITIWDRIEPRCRATDLTPGLEARVHDPLWLLARQWQVGEFEGHDAGSPVNASVQCSISPLERYSLSGQAQQSYDYRQPLETLVELESVRPADASEDIRQAAEAGLYFLRLLGVAQIPSSIGLSYVAQYALAVSPGSDAQGIAAAAFGRVIDGVKLRADLLAAGDNLPAQPAIPDAQKDAVLSVTRKWLTWYGALFSEPAQADGWFPDRMEYSFAMGAAGDTGSYIAREYDGDAVDWYTFDRSTVPLAGATPGGTTSASTLSKQVLVSPLTFRGMPARRFWEMEDAGTNIGALSAAAEDLGRLLLRNFALIYGSDWFQFPLAVPVGSLVLIDSLSVADTFGLPTAIAPYTTVDGAAGKWKMFQLALDPQSPPSMSTSAEPPHPLLLSPSAVLPVNSETLEDVLFLRDELANMAWGIERTVVGPSGQPIDRTLLWRTSTPPAPPPSGAEIQHYRLGSTVPDYWLPFLPIEANQGGPLMLRRGKLPTSNSGPMGRFLSYPNMTLFSEEVPREGVHLERKYRTARGLDGSAYLWIGRRRSTGSGEGRSGLKFDYLE